MYDLILSCVELLFLDTNTISGTLHNCFEKLSNLKKLFMFSNLITGSVPPSIGELKHLGKLQRYLVSEYVPFVLTMD